MQANANIDEWDQLLLDTDPSQIRTAQLTPSEKLTRITATAQARRPRPAAATSTLPAEPIDLNEFPPTERGTAQRLIARHGHAMRWRGDVGRYYTFDEKRWVEDIRGTVEGYYKTIARELLTTTEVLSDKDACRKHAVSCESARTQAAVLTLARTERGISMIASDFDQDPFALNTPTGTLDLRTGQLRPHSPTDFITKITTAAYDPAATCPMFEAVVERALAGNRAVIHYFQKAIGHAATGDISEQVFHVAHGSGANSKSTILEAIQNALGPYAAFAAPDLLTADGHSSHPTGIADLDGRRLVLASETDEGARLSVATVKMLTGDAQIKARRMRQDFYSFPRTFKLWLLTNNKPRVTEGTEAIWRRVRLIEFNVTIPIAERDPDLGEKLKAEASGILNWIIAGVAAWRRERLIPPSEIVSATDGYKSDEDPIADFVASRLILGPSHRCTRGNIYEVYRSFAVQAGENHPLGNRSFFDRLRKLQGVKDTKWQVIGTDDIVRGFSGVGIQAEGGGL